MNLIERYIHEVGRHLPRKNRSDIQAELRSLLTDALEDRAGDEAAEADVVALLKEFGTPAKVAASYYPEGQYLVGPTLYPVFRLIIGIVLAAVIFAQLLAVTITYLTTGEAFAPLQVLTALLNSVPAAVGMVVIVFVIMQRFGVRPELEEKEWDPRDLPQIEAIEPVKRGERVVGIIVSTLILVWLVFFPEKVGFVASLGGEFFANPIIGRYVLWISLALLTSIGLDIYLLWQGRWQVSSRLVKIGINLAIMAIVYLLYQDHTSWLAERGVSGFFPFNGVFDDVQMIGMQATRMALGIALIAIAVETIVLLARLVWAGIGKKPARLTVRAGKA